MDDHLAVGVVRAEDVTEADELGAQLGVVVDLAVEDEPERAVLVRHRLHRRRREVDDREPAIPEPDASVRGEPGRGAVGPAVDHRLAHAGDELAVDRGCGRVEAEDAGDAAHGLPERFGDRGGARQEADEDVRCTLAGMTVPERDLGRPVAGGEQRRDLQDSRRIDPEQRVRPELDRHRPLGRLPEGEARDTERRGLLLDPARVGDHEARVGLEAEKAP